MYSGLPLIPAAVPPVCSISGPKVRYRIRCLTGITPPPPASRVMTSKLNSEIPGLFTVVRPPPRIPGLISPTVTTAGNPLWDVTELLPLGEGATLSGKEARDDRALFADHLAGPHQNLHDGAVGG